MSIEDELKLSTNISPNKKAIVHLMFSGDCILNQINSVLKPFDMSSQQFNVLRILRGQKNKPVSLATIQERMINKKSNTTRLIDKLVLKEYVVREINKDNRRKMDISISPKGQNLLKRVDPLIDEVEQKITHKLTIDQLRLLNELLEHLQC